MDLQSVIFDGTYGCSGCHSGSTSCTGTAVQTNFGSYNTVAACIGNIRDKVSSSPSYGVRMPQGCSGGSCVSGTHVGYLSTWDGNGEPLSAPTVVSPNATGVSKTGASLRATFDPNVWSGTSVPGTYRFNYGPTTSYGTTTGAVNITGTTGVLRSTPISGLLCGTTYHFRGRVTNGAATVVGGNQSFSTSACTNPVISGGTTAVMSEDGAPTPFTPPNLSVFDNDPGTLSWSLAPGGQAGNGTAAVSGSGNFEVMTYSPDLNYTGPDSFTVRVRNLSTNLTDDHTINVTINPVDDPPVITEGAGPLAQTIDEDNNPTAFSLTLNATDNDTAAGNLFWSISGPAGNGTAAATGTGLSKAVTYTPNLNFNGTDSFTVQVFDGATADTITIDVTIDPRNDAPLINAIGAQTGTEGSLVTITPTVVDPDDPNNGTGALIWTFVSGQQAGMNLSNTGVITWTPPLGPPAVFDQMYPITIRVADGGEHGSIPDTDAFTLEIDPPDMDTDLVADYDDFCLSVADPTNADFDGDGVAGTDGGVNSGGDVCDLDDDNDTIPDAYELANMMDPFDPSDAAQDNDNDGITNLQEFLDGTNPNFANLVIDATGYLTPFDLPIPDPTTVHPMATSATASDNGPYRPGRNTIIWTGANGANPNLGTSDQTLDIRPLVSFAANQQVEEGAAVNVAITLNGNPPAYPVTVNYSVSGIANNPADHDAIAGVVTFTMPSVAETISFNVAADAITDPSETVLFSIDSVTNAAIGSSNSHQVTIVEANVAPQVEIRFTQGANVLATTYAGDGAIDIDAVAIDINAGQALSYDWSGTDNVLLPPGNVATWQMAAPVAGNYLVDVVVTDDGVPALSTRISRILNVVAGNAPPLGGTDTDGDGLNDNDPMEGHADDDGDGIPNYLDANSSGSSDSNLVPDQTVDIAASFLLQTDPGLVITRGNTAQAASSFGALLTDTEIAQFGSVNGTAPTNPDDLFEHVGGIYDFEVRGLISGASARVVIPLLSAVPRNAEYRKFNPATGWGGFVVNGNNRVASAQGAPGACPEPGSSEYRDGLNFLDNCIQLTIQDGGPNDTDNALNAVATDPGTVGVRLTDPEIEAVEDGGGRISPLMLAVLLVLGLFALRRRQVGVRAD